MFNSLKVAREILTVSRQRAVCSGAIFHLLQTVLARECNPRSPIYGLRGLKTAKFALTVEWNQMSSRKAKKKKRSTGGLPGFDGESTMAALRAILSGNQPFLGMPGKPVPQLTAPRSPSTRPGSSAQVSDNLSPDELYQEWGEAAKSAGQAHPVAVRIAAE